MKLFFDFQAARPHMQPGSTVLFISSTTAHAGFAACGAYSATKGAVEAMTRSLACRQPSSLRACMIWKQRRTTWKTLAGGRRHGGAGRQTEMTCVAPSSRASSAGISTLIAPSTRSRSPERTGWKSPG